MTPRAAAALVGFFLRTIFLAPGRNPVPFVTALLLGLLQMEGTLNGYHAAAALLVLPLAMPRALRTGVSADPAAPDFVSLLPVSARTFRGALLAAAMICAALVLVAFGAWLAVESRLPPLDQGEFVERTGEDGTPVRIYRGFAKSLRGVPYPAEENVPWSLLFDGLPASPGWPVLPAAAWFAGTATLLFAAGRTGLERTPGGGAWILATRAAMALPLLLLALDLLAAQSWIHSVLTERAGGPAALALLALAILVLATGAAATTLLTSAERPASGSTSDARTGVPTLPLLPHLARVQTSALLALWEIDLWIIAPVWVFALMELPVAPASVNMLIALFLGLFALAQLAAATVRREAGGWPFHYTLPIGIARFVSGSYVISLVPPVVVLFAGGGIWTALLRPALPPSEIATRLGAGVLLLLLVRGLTGNSLILVSRNALYAFGYLVLCAAILLGAHIGNEFLGYVIPMPKGGVVLLAALANLAVTVPLARTPSD